MGNRITLDRLNMGKYYNWERTSNWKRKNGGKERMVENKS